jgi:hypothetical protein
MMPPAIQLVDGKEFCKIVPYYHWPTNTDNRSYEAEVNNSNINEICSNFTLTEEDKNIIFDFVGKLKSNYGYTNIEKQTDNDYANFLEKMNKINSDICNCQKIVIHGRNGMWTAYTDGFKETCSFSPACYQPPIFCYNGNNYFNEILVLVAVVSICVIIVLVRRHRK